MDRLLEKLCNYILSNDLLSESEMNMIVECDNEIKQIAPTDRRLLFNKEQTLINCSQNLSWCIYSIRLKYSKILNEYRKLRDPEYTILVRQGRPSAAAIETELRYKHDNFYEYDENLRILENIIEFLNHMELSVDRYLYMLRDKLRYND